MGIQEKKTEDIMLETLIEVKQALDAGKMILDPELIMKTSDELPKFIQLVNKVNLAIYLGKGGFNAANNKLG